MNSESLGQNYHPRNNNFLRYTKKGKSSSEEKCDSPRYLYESTELRDRDLLLISGIVAFGTYIVEPVRRLFRRRQ